jgi:hypothetical protein
VRPHFAKARAVGDKIPMINRLLPAIAARFTQARVVFIVRNLFDVANSFQVRCERGDDDTWPLMRDYRRACVDWNSSLEGLGAWSKKLPMMVIDYESFFAGAARLDAMAKFLDLDVGPLREAYEEELHRIRPAKALPILTPLQKQYVTAHGDFAAYVEALALARRWRFPGFMPFNRAITLHPKYAREDARIVDYGYQPFAGRLIRGPVPTGKSGSTIAALGAASTFGRLVRTPYIETVAVRLECEPLNLGYGGARAPLFYLSRELMQKINRCAAAVIEVFSARGTGTASVESRDHVSTFLRKRNSGDTFTFAPAFYERLARDLPKYDLAALLSDIRECYMAEMMELLRQIKIPKILVWFSQRPPDSSSALDAGDFSGTFPHFVDRRMVSALAAKCQGYVEFVSTDGLPSELVDRDTGEAVAIFPQRPNPALNDYYPSQKMHDGLADELVPILRGTLEGKS